MDSIRAYKYADSTLVDSALHATESSSWDTTWTVGSDTNWTILFLAYDTLSQDYPSGWVWTLDLRSTVTTDQWRILAYWPDATDSIQVKFDSAGTDLVDSSYASVQNYVAVRAVYPEIVYQNSINIFYAGETIPVSYTFQTHWDTTGGGVGVSPASASYAYVQGYLIGPDGAALEGAIITAVRSVGPFATDTTGGGYGLIISRAARPVFADSSGFFQLELMRTDSTDNSAKAYYDITGRYGGEDVFTIKSLFVPGTGNVDLGDSLAAR